MCSKEHNGTRIDVTLQRTLQRVVDASFKNGFFFFNSAQNFNKIQKAMFLQALAGASVFLSSSYLFLC